MNSVQMESLLATKHIYANNPLALGREDNNLKKIDPIENT